MTKIDKKTKRKQIDKTLITDYMAVTRYSDPNQAFQVYQEKRKEGKQDVAWTRGVLTEEYPEMKKKAILDVTIEQIELLQFKMRKEMDISWEINEVEKE